MQETLHDFVASLFEADSLEEAFDHYQKEVTRFGFDGVVYGIIPRPILQSQFQIRPVYQVSAGFGSEFMHDYWQSELYKSDPFLDALQAGVEDPLDWNSKQSEPFVQRSGATRAMFEATKDHGLNDGLLIPLMSDERGVAGTTVVCRNSADYAWACRHTLSPLRMRARLFHNLVLSRPEYSHAFAEPLLEAFNEKQLGYVVGLSSGLSTGDVAWSLGTSVGYLEQTMLKLRKKLSGVGEFEQARINRNQVLYTAGTLNLMRSDIIDSLPPLRSAPAQSVSRRRKAGSTSDGD